MVRHQESNLNHITRLPLPRRWGVRWIGTLRGGESLSRLENFLQLSGILGRLFRLHPALGRLSHVVPTSDLRQDLRFGRREGCLGNPLGEGFGLL